jgi:hypothetical protein
MAIEDLEKALDLSTCNFLISFWLFIANKNKPSKDIYNVSLHQLCEKPQNYRTVGFGVFQKHERTRSFHERTGKE